MTAVTEQQRTGDRTDAVLAITDWERFEEAMSYLQSNHIDVNVWKRPSNGGRDQFIGSIRPNPSGEPQLADLPFLRRTSRDSGLNQGDELVFSFRQADAAVLFKLTWGGK